jgi:branched-chain amino acid transport system permease protein
VGFSRLSRARLALALTALCLVCLPAAATLAGQPFWITIATRVVIYALAVAALDFIVGYGGMLSLGHAAFFAIGSYAVAFAAKNGVHVALANWPLAVLVAGIFAAAIGAVSVRTSGIFFIMITLAFAQMVYYLVNGIKPLGGDDGLPMTVRDSLPLVGLGNPVVFYLVSLGLLAAFVLFSQRAIRARFGTVLRAAMQNERRVTALGFDVYRYRWLAFTISGAATGLAGALFADFSRIATTDSATWLQSGDLLVMLILGGAGTLLGPIFGAAAFVVLQTVLIGLTEHWMIVLGPILIFVVLVGKRGIAGLIAGEDA